VRYELAFDNYRWRRLPPRRQSCSSWCPRARPGMPSRPACPAALGHCHELTPAPAQTRSPGTTRVDAGFSSWLSGGSATGPAPWSGQGPGMAPARSGDAAAGGRRRRGGGGRWHGAVTGAPGSTRARWTGSRRGWCRD